MLKKVVVVLLLVAVAYAGFRWGGLVFPRLERALGVDATARPVEEAGPTPELAEEALDRFERFRDGELGDRVAFDGRELTAVVRHALPGLIPPGVAEPSVRLRDGKVEVTARVAVEDFPELPRLDQLAGLLPDTVDVEVRGSLVPLDQGTLALVADGVRVAKIPVPERMVADVLKALGRSGPASLPPNGVLVPMPDGVEAVFVLGDSLVLRAKPGPAGGR